MDQTITSTDNLQGTNLLRAVGTVDTSNPYTDIFMEDGRVLRLATSRLVELSSTHSLNVDVVADPTDTVIPLIEEQLTVGKRVVPTGKITLEKTVQEYDHKLNEPLALRTYDIERKVLNQPVESVPTMRHEGETTIYPVVEEQIILTKQLILKEEIHVRRRDDIRVDEQVVTLKREHITVQRENIASKHPASS